jgi:DNA polymerase/3'-5' exonuclease PolX
MPKSRTAVITLLKKVAGIGDVGASELYARGVRGKADLRAPAIYNTLSAETQCHLKYNYLRRISREMVKEIAAKVPKLILVGSGRRNVAYSRDLDFLTTLPLNTAAGMFGSAGSAMGKNGSGSSASGSVSLIATINHGASRRSLIISYKSKNIKVDIFRTAKSCMGAALLHHTGSKNFNIRVRAQAKRLGYKLSQFGLFDSSGKVVAGANTERAILAKINVTYISPEERNE